MTRQFSKQLSFTVVLLSVLISASTAPLVVAEEQQIVPKRTWQGIPGLERTAQGRVFASWFTGGSKEPAPENTVCDAPDATPPVFGDEFRVGFDVPYAFRMNKPTVLSSGEWIMPVTLAQEPIYGWFAG